MSTTQDTAATDLRIVKDPTTPKEKAIVDAVLDDPTASNPAIADRVEGVLGDRPDPSWVSRVRSSFLRESEADDYGTNKIDDVVARLDRVEGKVDDVGSTEDVDRAIEAVENLTDTVEVLIDEVRDMKATVGVIEDMVARDINDEVVEYVLKKELDRVDDSVR